MVSTCTSRATERMVSEGQCGELDAGVAAGLDALQATQLRARVPCCTALPDTVRAYCCTRDPDAACPAHTGTRTDPLLCHLSPAGVRIFRAADATPAREVPIRADTGEFGAATERQRLWLIGTICVGIVLFTTWLIRERWSDAARKRMRAQRRDAIRRLETLEGD